MKAARLDGVQRGLKARMRALKVAQGRRQLEIPRPTKTYRGRTYALHPTKGWRIA